MGFPIRTNIFSEKIDNSWIKKFPVQMIVLFSPGDKEFLSAFNEIFLDLDQLTGRDIIFFAVLDPPEEWTMVAGNRKDWSSYWEQEPVGYSMDDRMLIEEIARKFKVKWSDLPVIIVSTDLWNAEHISFKTSPLLITDQMHALKKLVQKSKESFDLDIGYIAEALSDRSGVQVSYNPPDIEMRNDFARFYNILDLANNRIRRYWEDIYFRHFYQSRQNNQRNTYEQFQYNESYNDSLQRFYASQLVPFVARLETHQNRSLHFQQDEEKIQALDVDDESWTMISRALRIGRFIDDDQTQEQLNYRSGLPQRRILEDYSPAAQGLWKSFEKEVNLSIVQAFRSSRAISMPMYFAKFFPDFSGNKFIKTEKRTVDINQRDWEDPEKKRHRFIELGPAFHCTNVMMGNVNEDFDQVILRCLDGSIIPKSLLDDWEQIIGIRNPPSHTELLSREGFRRMVEMVIENDNLSILARIKHALS